MAARRHASALAERLTKGEGAYWLELVALAPGLYEAAGLNVTPEGLVSRHATAPDPTPESLDPAGSQGATRRDADAPRDAGAAGDVTGGAA